MAPSRGAERAPIHATPWIDRLQSHIPVARLGADPEGVHQVRVAAARLRVWLRLGGRRALADDLAWLRAGAAEVRDIDVLLTLGGPQEYMADLAARRAVARAGLLGVLDAPRTGALIIALRCSPPIDRRRAKRKVREWVARAGRAGNHLDWLHVSDRDLHAFRRRIRRLRYALDWIDRPMLSVKELSEDLGAVNDLAVLIDRLEEGEHPASDSLTVDEVRTRLVSRRTEIASEWPTLAKALEKEAP